MMTLQEFEQLQKDVENYRFIATVTNSTIVHICNSHCNFRKLDTRIYTYGNTLCQGLHGDINWSIDSLAAEIMVEVIKGQHR